MFDNNGNEIVIGDTVQFENGKTTGRVIHVLENPLDLETWALKESGIMVEAEEFGLVFLPASCFIDHEVRNIIQPEVANGDKH